MIKISTKDFFYKLSQYGLSQISFHGIINVGGQNIDITKFHDLVGNIIKEWIEGWLGKNNISFANNPNTQMPPDIFLNVEDKTKDLLEVKAFNYEASPGFDIADFKAYQREIIRQPYMLDTKYIIFGYSMSEEGVVTIKKVWLKNVWEICRTSDKWPVNVQFRNGVVHKIRPANWFSNSKRINYTPFECLEDFLAAIEDTVYKNPDTRDQAIGWKERMEKSYSDFYGKQITIPRWMDVKDKYLKKPNK